MKKYEGVYLYSDMDSTLLDDEKRISKENLSAINAFIRQGGCFAMATGRTPMNSACYADLLPINAPCILYNGGALYDIAQGRYLTYHPIDKNAAMALARRAMALEPQVCVQIFTLDAIYEPNPNQLPDAMTLMEGSLCRPVPLAEIPGVWMKVILARPADRLSELVSALDIPRYEKQFHAIQTADVYEEFAAWGTGKGPALGDVRRCVPGVKRILAIGDHYNDVDLVAWADVGAAPSNAVDAVKEQADLVLPVDNNHHAIAKFLELAL